MIIENLKVEDVNNILFPKACNFAEKFNYKIRNQYEFLSCTAHAWIVCIEYIRQIDGYQFENLSVVYHYYMSRKLDNNEKKITGMSAKKSLESFFVNGASKEKSEKNWLIEDINAKPESHRIKEARKRVIDNILIYNVEINVKVFKYILNKMNVPFVVVIKVTTGDIDLTPIIFKFDEKEVLNDLHTICIVGYNEDEETFIFQNSYGTEWHYGGFGKIHYSYLKNITEGLCINHSCIKDEEQIEGLTLVDYSYLLELLIK